MAKYKIRHFKCRTNDYEKVVTLITKRGELISMKEFPKKCHLK